jgi:phenylpropionate dioxygenase-like ring-hydroxylating dioxygenase large terminal subunit
VTDGGRDELAGRRRRDAWSICRRLVAHLAAGGTTDFAPAPMEHSARAYTDPARAALEVSELFLRRPLIAGLSRDVRGVGDRLVFDAVGRSVIIVRDAEGALRAFRNSCAHRGARLLQASADGRCHESGPRITCPFHAWSYDLGGALRSIPGAEGFEGVDRHSRGLIPVPVVEWNGAIFVRLDGADPIDCEALLGAFAPVIEQLELAQFEPVQSSARHARTNWKYALDTYGEGYHFGTLHASSIGATHVPNVAAFDPFGPHWRLSFAPRSLGALVGRPESSWPEPHYGGIHFIFPNTVLVLGQLEADEAFVRIFRIFPGATPGEMSCQFSVYARGVPASALRARFGVDDSKSDVTDEDYRVAVEAYANLAVAPPGFRLVFGRNEPAIQLFHRAVADAIGAWP